MHIRLWIARSARWVLFCLPRGRRPGWLSNGLHRVYVWGIFP